MSALAEEARAYFRDHPQILAEFCRILLCHKASGMTHSSAKLAFEELRHGLPGSPRTGLRLRNAYSATAARLALARHPELRGFIRLAPLAHERIRPSPPRAPDLFDGASP